MKYLKNKNSRRRGAALELAMMMFLAMTAVTILVVNTTMIQVNRQKQSYNDLAEVVEGLKEKQYDEIGKIFINCVINEYTLYNKALEEDHNLDLNFSRPTAATIQEKISNSLSTESHLQYKYEVTPGGADNDLSFSYTFKIKEPSTPDQEGQEVYILTVQFLIVKNETDRKYEPTFIIIGRA